MEHSRANSPAYDYTDCGFTHIFRCHQFIYLDIHFVPKCNSLNSALVVYPTSQIETLAFLNKRINKSQMTNFEYVQEWVGQIYMYSGLYVSTFICTVFQVFTSVPVMKDIFAKTNLTVVHNTIF